MERRRHFPTIIALATYLRDAKGVIGEAEDEWITERLRENPRAGAVVAETGGVRKLRVPRPGTGKRGGARLIYYHRSAVGRVYLLTVYAKAAQADLSSLDRKLLRGLVRQLDREP